jgi:hypothetical protein
VPISYQIDRTAALIRTRCYGHITLHEVLGHFRDLRQESALPKRLDVFLDLHEVTSRPTAEEIRIASKEPGALQGTVTFGCCAIVVDRDALFGMARMWGIFAEGSFVSVNVFRSTTEAEAWLEAQRLKESDTRNDHADLEP